MTREEAQRACAELAESSPERETHRFFPREDDSGEWQVAKVNLPGGNKKLGTETKAETRPPNGEDPRPAYWRNVGGPYVG
jgi:hypothetical protein